MKELTITMSDNLILRVKTALAVASSCCGCGCCCKVHHESHHQTSKDFRHLIEKFLSASLNDEL